MPDPLPPMEGRDLGFSTDNPFYNAPVIAMYSEAQAEDDGFLVRIAGLGRRYEGHPIVQVTRGVFDAIEATQPRGPHDDAPDTGVTMDLIGQLLDAELPNAKVLYPDDEIHLAREVEVDGRHQALQLRMGAGGWVLLVPSEN